MLARVVGFDFLEAALEGALGVGFVAAEGGEQVQVFGGPLPGVAGQTGFDLFQAFAVALEMPVGEGGVVDQHAGTETKAVISLHEPHPRKELKAYQVKDVLNYLKAEHEI